MAGGETGNGRKDLIKVLPAIFRLVSCAAVRFWLFIVFLVSFQRETEDFQINSFYILTLLHICDIM